MNPYKIEINGIEKTQQLLFRLAAYFQWEGDNNTVLKRAIAAKWLSKAIQLVANSKKMRDWHDYGGL